MTVLAAVDDTPAARTVLGMTSAVRRVLHVHARAVHVGEPPGPAGYAEEFGIPMFFLDGEPEAQIVAAGEGPDVSLVVLAQHGLPGDHATGQTALAVATHLTKPLLVVPPDYAVRPTPRRLLFPLDGTGGVSAAMRPLIATYVAAGVEVIALHVFEPATVPRFLDGPPDAVIWRDEFLARHGEQLKIRLVTRPGPIVAALLDLAESEDVDAIAMGWRQDLAPHRAQVVQEVLMRSHRPVALVPLPRPRRNGTGQPR